MKAGLFGLEKPQKTREIWKKLLTNAGNGVIIKIIIQEYFLKENDHESICDQDDDDRNAHVCHVHLCHAVFYDRRSGKEYRRIIFSCGPFSEKQGGFGQVTEVLSFVCSIEFLYGTHVSKFIIIKGEKP